MRFLPTSLVDAVIIELEKFTDARGYFARTMCHDEFAKNGLIANFVQSNHSYNAKKGTLRGMHYQRAPHGEAKLVRCIRGGVFDAIIDLRPESKTYMQWEGFELTADNGRMLYVPPQFAHGFLTLTDDAEVVYQVSHPYTPEAEAGCRFDDPAFGISWPAEVRILSDKDMSWPTWPAR